MRFLHWLMAAMVLTMLGIGMNMVSSLASYHSLISIHRPLGILILVVVVVRYVSRRFSVLPPFPATMSSQKRFAASKSELVYIAACAAASRLGDVVGGSLSDRTVWVAASFPHPSAQCHLVRGAAENAHGPRQPVIPDVHCSFWSCSVSHADRARCDVRPYGAVESPRGLASSGNTAAELRPTIR